MILAVDGGNDNTKFYDGRQLIQFPSAIGINDLQRNLKGERGAYDFEWEFEGKCGFAGTLARESEYAESRRDDSKAHFDAKLRILLALHQFGGIGNAVEYDLVVGQPIDFHTDAEKTAIKEMMIKSHELTVNGIRKTICIRRCEVTAEGVAAGLLASGNGLVRIIDIGSGSVNYGTVQNRGFNNKGSFTYPEGMQTKRKMDHGSFARQIATKALNRKWEKEDAVFLCGGGAPAILPYITEFFPTAQLLEADPIFSNVKAFYLIARKLYAKT